MLWFACCQTDFAIVIFIIIYIHFTQAQASPFGWLIFLLLDELCDAIDTECPLCDELCSR